MSENEEQQMHKRSSETIKDTLKGISEIGDKLVGNKGRK